MNKLISNFSGFDGRIGRQDWWIGSIILFVIGIVLALIAATVFGAALFTSMASMPVGTDITPEAASAALAASAGPIQTLAWAFVVIWLLLLYPSLALGIKRRHDKDNNGYDVIGYVVLQVLMNLLVAFGMGGNIVVTVLSWASLVYAIYLLVVLGFLKGITGPNQYGPDPLGGTVAVTT